MSKKYCMDCKHYTPDEVLTGAEWARCAVGRKKVDPVSGKLTDKYPRYCESNRELDWLMTRILGVCGKEGRLWEAK